MSYLTKYKISQNFGRWFRAAKPMMLKRCEIFRITSEEPAKNSQSQFWRRGGWFLSNHNLFFLFYNF